MPNITVTVYDSTENKRVPVELPDDAPANRIIAVLVDKLQLPQNGPDGAPLSYKFHHKNSGRQIQDAQTLADAAVKEGDILRLQPEITAGADGVSVSSLRDERLPKGPRPGAAGTLDADTASGSVFKLTHYPGAR
ncbi:MAG TPA: EsaB/YukD family protein [Candidatus Angelobacter sp.]|nr:EsaB/YukD family protein [Candidatus Angelobacter sp.]